MFPKAGRESQWGFGSHDVNGKSGVSVFFSIWVQAEVGHERKNHRERIKMKGLHVYLPYAWPRTAAAKKWLSHQMVVASCSFHHLLLSGQVYHNISILWFSCTLRKVIYVFSAYFPFHLNQKLGMTVFNAALASLKHQEPNRPGSESGLKRALREPISPPWKWPRQRPLF